MFPYQKEQKKLLKLCFPGNKKLKQILIRLRDPLLNESEEILIKKSMNWVETNDKSNEKHFLKNCYLGVLNYFILTNLEMSNFLIIINCLLLNII